MGMGNYDLYDQPDPDEERKRQEEAFAALAAAGGAAQPELAPSPPPVELPPPDLSLLRNPALNDELPGAEPVEIPGAIPDLPDPSVEGRAFSALAAKPHEGWESEFAVAPDPTESAVSALAGASAPRAPEPAEGPSSAFRSPTSQDSPVPGQIKEAPPESTPSQPPPPMAAAEPPAQVDPLEALMRRGEEQRTKQLADYDKEGAPGVNGWALLADVAFNKGRSIPGILQQADADKRHFQEGRQKLLTGGAHADPVNQMLAMERIRTGQGNLDARNKGQQRLTDNDAVKTEEAKKATAAFRVAYKSVLTPEEDAALADAPPSTFRTLSGMFRQKYGNLESTQDEHARGAGKDTTARVAATIDTENENKDTKADTVYTTETARRKAEAEQLGTRPNTPLQDEQLENTRESLRLQREGASRSAAAETERQSRQKIQDDAGWKATFDKNTKDARDVAATIDGLDELEAKWKGRGKPVPGKGVEGGMDLAGGMLSGGAQMLSGPEKKEQLADADAYAIAIGGMGLDFLYGKSGKTFSPTEIDKNAIRTGTKFGATADQVDLALTTMRDLVTRHIGGQASARPDLAREIFQSTGRDADKWGAQNWVGRSRAPAPTAPSSTPAPGGGGFDITTVPDQLTTTPQKGRELPRVGDVVRKPSAEVEALGNVPPKAAARALEDTSKPTFKVTVTLPNGRSFDEDAATSEELKMLETTMGARIQVRQ